MMFGGVVVALMCSGPACERSPDVDSASEVEPSGESAPAATDDRTASSAGSSSGRRVVADGRSGGSRGRLGDAGETGGGLKTSELEEGTEKQGRLLKRARSHFLAGRLEKAEPMFETLVGRGPMSGARASGYIALGEIYLQTDRPGQAISLLESMPPPGRKVVEAQLVLARAYRSRGDVDTAIRVYKRVLRLQPNYLFVYRELGRIYGEQGEQQKASTIFGMYEKRLRALASELEHPDESRPTKRINILDVFSMLSNQRAEQAVREALEDPKFRVRRRAVQAVGEMNIRRARDRLETMAEEDPFRVVRREARRVLDQLEQ